MEVRRPGLEAFAARGVRGELPGWVAPSAYALKIVTGLLLGVNGFRSLPARVVVGDMLMGPLNGLIHSVDLEFVSFAAFVVCMVALSVRFRRKILGVVLGCGALALWMFIGFCFCGMRVT